MKLAQKMTIGFSLIVLLAVGGIAINGYFQTKDQLTAKIENNMSGIADKTSENLNAWFAVKARDVETTASIMGTASDPNVIDYFMHSKSDPDIENMYIGMPNGKLIDVNRTQLPPGFNATTRDWYKTAINAQGIVFSSPYIDASTNKMVISPSIKIQNTSGNASGSPWSRHLLNNTNEHG